MKSDRTGTTDSKAKGAKTDPGTHITFDQKGLFERLHDANQREIALGQLAQKHATLQQTKDFAQMMITHHTQADKDLMAMAAKMKITPGKPTPANAMEKQYMAHAKMLPDVLKAMNGQLFDSMYLANMVGEHDHAVALVTASLTKFQDKPELATLLKTLQPQLVSHREEAYRNLGAIRMSDPGAVGGSGSVGTESMPKDSMHMNHGTTK